MDDHLLPFLVDHPSTVAISSVTVAPRITSPVARSVAYAVQELRSLLNSNLSVVNLRLELMAAIINWLLQLGLPWIICRFCITINGAMFNRVEISNAMRQLATLPRKASGTKSELANALLMRWARSNAVVPVTGLNTAAGCGSTGTIAVGSSNISVMSSPVCVQNCSITL